MHVRVILVRTRGLTEAERQRSLFKGAAPKKVDDKEKAAGAKA